MLKCPFCNPSGRVLKQNESAQVILSDPRKVPGHILVIPKRHVQKPWLLTKAELGDIFDLIFFVERKIVGKLGDGCDIRQNYRPFITQNKLKVDHIHFHIIPRSLNDYLYTISEQYEDGLFAELDETESSAVSRLLV